MSEEQVWQSSIHIEGENQNIVRLATVPGHVPWREAVNRWAWQAVHEQIERHGGPNNVERVELVLKRTVLGASDEECDECPPEVLECVQALSENYTEVDFDRDGSWDVFHLYPRELAYPSGFYDSRVFELVVFNERAMTKANVGLHDGIRMGDGGVEVLLTRIFADGSTLIRFKNPVQLAPYQEVLVFSGAGRDAEKGGSNE